jgi:selenide, water dikinase
MQKTNAPVAKDLVLVGGGHSHVAVLRRFGMRPLPGLRLTLVTRDIHTPYSGMLPGYIAGHYDFDECHIDLGPLARFAGARLYHGEVERLDPGKRRMLQVGGRPPVVLRSAVHQYRLPAGHGADVPGSR